MTFTTDKEDRIKDNGQAGEVASFADLMSDNHFARLPEHFYTRQAPAAIQDPRMVAVNQSVLTLLGLAPELASSDELLQLSSGNWLAPNFAPLAMKYAGHQFGQYNPALGDGRGLLLAQVQAANHMHTWDLHLKGAGRTPYSRQGDGRAVLRSSIREFLCSAAMQGLGVPTTLALSVTVGSDSVQREDVEQAAMLLRVAPSHIRFGHFEHFYYTQQWDELSVLLDYTIAQHFPQLKLMTQPYVALFEQVVNSTAVLMAHWQSIGFVHGVMNTDNMSILGETFDYGPFAFQDSFDPRYVCNHTDYNGRYAFNQQPQMGYWNLMALARALTPVIELDMLNQILTGYDDIFLDNFRRLMRAKLGLVQVRAEDGKLIKDLLTTLADNQIDYSYFFRQLSQFNSAEGAMNETLRDLFIERKSFDIWAGRYQQRLLDEASIDIERQLQMNRVNPKYILRNYLAQQAIAKAQEHDFSMVRELLLVLQDPFAEHPQYQHYAQLPPAWGQHMTLSCSS